MHIFRRANEELAFSLQAYSEGDLEVGRAHLNKARALFSHINRHGLTRKNARSEDRTLNSGENPIETAESLVLFERVKQSFERVESWLEALILSVGREELLTSEEGVDLLLDRGLPNHWDFKHDIAIVSGDRSDEFIARLLARGQIQVVKIGVVGAADCIEHVPAFEVSTGGYTTSATILTADVQNRLSQQQLLELKKTELPNFVYLPTDANTDGVQELDGLFAQIRARYVVEATMRKHIPTWVEQLLENLPTIGQMCTAGDLAHSFSDKDILIASAGPSLVESLPSLREYRDSFIVISLLGSLPVLLDSGITPDFAIMCDAVDHTRDEIGLLPEDERYREIPLIVAEHAHPTAFEGRFKYCALVPRAELIGGPISLAIHGSDAPRVVGGSVATYAVSLFAQLGVASITLVGQDLSVPLQGKTYASDNIPVQSNIANRSFLTCLGINGEYLPTLSDYSHFIDEFGKLGSQYGGEISLFNSTVFGAFLDNWVHTALDSNHPVVDAASERGGVKSVTQTHSFEYAQKSYGSLECCGARDHSAKNCFKFNQYDPL